MKLAGLSRCFEVLLAVLLLLIFLPLMLLLVIIIKADSAGPALYYQDCLGLGGKPFTIVKFRSMRVNAEASGPCWAGTSDTRITRVGSLLRLTRLDELPQLLNILSGDMALIGPRPERAHVVNELATLTPQFRSRLLIRPGLTGWAQVNMPYGASAENSQAKLVCDLDDIRNRNV